MYVEDESDKVIRLAKRKAYGPCDRHQDHFNGENFFLGILVGAIPMLIAAVIFFAPSKYDAKAVNIQYSCITTDSKSVLGTGYSGYLNTPSSLTIEANSTCTFASN